MTIPTHENTTAFRHPLISFIHPSIHPFIHPFISPGSPGSLASFAPNWAKTPQGTPQRDASEGRLRGTQHQQPYCVHCEVVIQEHRRARARVRDSFFFTAHTLATRAVADDDGQPAMPGASQYGPHYSAENKSPQLFSCSSTRFSMLVCTSDKPSLSHDGHQSNKEQKRRSLVSLRENLETVARTPLETSGARTSMESSV